MTAPIQTIPKLAELHDEASAQALLHTFGLINVKAARTIFQRIELSDRNGLETIFPFLLAALAACADPDRSLINFDRFVESLGPGLFLELLNNPRVIEILLLLFSASPFLTEIILRTPDALELLNNRQALTERKTIEQFQNEAILAANSCETESGKLDAIRRYQRRQYLRIGASDFLGLYDLRAVFSQLSRMAIGLVRACLILATQQSGISPGGFVVLAMGKLGGWELNYSSDIDLLFVAKKNTVSYVNLAERMIDNLTRSTSEGFLYRVDLRLRPWGIDGSLITTSDGYLQYIQKHARLWEKQAFLKARPIAGNLSFGEEIRKEIEPFLFSTPAAEVRDGIYAMKQKTEEFLKEKGRHWGEVKLGEGSIRDIEFVVQSLQMTHPSIRTRATLKAIPRLQEQGLISSSEAHILTSGYNFLRTIEHYLQMIDYRQTYTLPSDLSSLALLSRRLGFEGPHSTEQFIVTYEQHCQAIRSVFLKYVGLRPEKELANSAQASPQVLEHIARMDASYSAAFSRAEVQSHALLASFWCETDPL